MNARLILAVLAASLLIQGAGSSSAETELRAARAIPIRKVQPPDNASFPNISAMVRKAVEELAQEAGFPQGKVLRIHVGGHGRESSAEDIWQNVIEMARASGADAAIALDFPEMRGPGEELTWHWRSVKASKKTALAVAAINACRGSVVWSMRGESAMAENIVRMYEVATEELKPLIRVEGNIVMDSYPFASAPFMPREISGEFLSQVGGTVYLNFTKFGHWSNPLSGGPKLVNVCVAPGGHPISHGYYEVVDLSRQLETLEISGAPVETVKAFVERIGTCEYLEDMLGDLPRTELPNHTPPMVTPVIRK
ncbi:MAG: hypothetical protein HY922_01730 [Elusimicrobia bacterium]|nr:hypothetical protein [Elusimicrobiota bacterium]